MKLIYLLVLSVLASNPAYAIPDWSEGSGTISCAWAKDVPGGKFVPGVGAPTVTLNFYADQSGSRQINSIQNDHQFYFAVAKKGQFVKLKINEKIVGWVPERQLEFGALRNCN